MTASTDPADFDPSELIFLTRGVSHADVSAVTAVLRAVLQEESDSLRLAPVLGQSAWQVSQRGIRLPLTPGHGRWRSFSA